MKKGLGTKLATRRADQVRVQLRFGLNVVAILVLMALVVAAVGVYLTLHQSVVPAHPGAGHVFFPTKMITASIGWSWVGSSELWRTTDAGANWTNVSPPSLPDRLLHYRGDLHGPVYYSDFAYLLDATHAWVAETGHSAAFGGGLYIATFRTTDGGKTWHEGASIGGVSPELFFIDQDHGWLLLPAQDSPPTDSTRTLYSTDDAGLHWNLKSSALWTGWFCCSPGPETMTFSSLTTGWISGENLMVTHDGGVTWHVQPLPVTVSTESYVSVPTFFDPRRGIAFFDPHPAGCSSGCPPAVLDPARLLVTTDGGSTWVVRSIPGEAPLQWPVDFVDADHGWVIAGTAADFLSDPGVPLPLYRTDDGGLTWVSVPTNVLWLSQKAHMGPIEEIDFVDQNNGFAVRRKYLALDYTQLLKTTDGGRTWTVVVEAPKTP